MLDALLGRRRRRGDPAATGRCSRRSSRRCRAATASASPATSGAVRLVVIDCRNGRVLEPGRARDGRRRGVGVDRRRMQRRRRPPADRHVAAGVRPRRPARPAALERGGLRRCVGPRPGVPAALGGAAAPGSTWRTGRRSVARSTTLVELLGDVASGRDLPAPATISRAVRRHPLLLPRPRSASRRPPGRRPVHQLVNSPIRNALTPPEKLGMRIAMSPVAALAGAGAAALDGAAPHPDALADGPRPGVGQLHRQADVPRP